MSALAMPPDFELDLQPLLPVPLSLAADLHPHLDAATWRRLAHACPYAVKHWMEAPARRRALAPVLADANLVERERVLLTPAACWATWPAVKPHLEARMEGLLPDAALRFGRYAAKWEYLAREYARRVGHGSEVGTTPASDPEGPRQWLTTTEAAARLRMSDRAVRKLAESVAAGTRRKPTPVVEADKTDTGAWLVRIREN